MRLAKVSLPGAPSRGVAREAVSRTLDGLERSSDRGGVVLVSAPAGHGKSVAVADWVRGDARIPAAWVSLDPFDRAEPQWWSAIRDALRVAEIVGARDPLALLPAAWTSPEATERRELVEATLGVLERLDSRTRLVIDDVQDIVGHPSFEGLRELLRYPLPHLTIVLISRYDPPVGLDRLRLGDRLGELRSEQLVFTLAETADLFERQGLALTSEQVEMLRDRTEGWVAALRLAALSLRRVDDVAAFVDEFAGDDHSVTDYLVGEVWSRLGEDERVVLEAACVSSPLPAELAAVLTDHPDAGEVLDHLEIGTGLVGPTDRHRKHHRTHQLLRSHVLARLRRHRPDHLRDLYRRAATWYEARGEVAEALRCTATGGDVAATQALMRHRAIEMLGRGELSVLESTEQLVGDAIGDPEVRLVLGLVALEQGDLVRAERSVAAADDGSTAPESTDLTVLRRIVATRIAGAHGRLADACALADTIRAEAVNAPALRVLALTTRANGLTLPRPDRARRDAELAVEVAAQHGWRYLALQAETVLGLLQVHGGGGSGSTGRARAAVDDATRGGWGASPWLLRARLVLAAAELARGRPHAVLATLAQADAVTIEGHPQVRWAFDVVRGAAELDAGEPLASWRRLREARLSSSPGQDVDRHVALGMLFEQQAAMRLGRLRDATELARIGAERLGECAESVLLEVRVDWWRHRDPAGAQRLAPVLDRRVRAVTAMGIVEPLALAAEVALARGERATANRHLHRALRLAEHFGAVRPLVQASDSVRTFLAAQRGAHGRHDALIDEVLALEPTARLGQAGLVDTLTERERSVLEHLPTMRSAAEIAADLGVSINTVKTHQRGIYQKLGVDTRREAVVRARTIGLLGTPTA